MLVKASSTQRFIAFFIDFFIINYVASLLCNLVYLVTGDIGAVADKYYTELINIYNQGALVGRIDIDLLYAAFGSFMQYYLLDFAITLPIILILDVLYLVVLPKKFKYQTIGRLVASCRVVALDKNLSYKKLLVREILGTFIFYQILGTFGIIISLILVITRGYSLVDRISKCALVRNVVVRRVQREDYTEDSYKKDDYVDATFKDVSDNEYKKDDNHSNDDDDYRII